MKFSEDSLYLIAIISTSVMFFGCIEENRVERESLVDDFGQEYYLYQNEDGTETIRYRYNLDPSDEDDDYYEETSTVKIRRNEDNSIDYISGNEELILGLATGYLLLHGIDSKVKYDKGKYVPITPSAFLSPSMQSEKLSNYRPGTTTIKPQPRSGFGSAGIRSSVS